jgi:hypothetical protein
MQEVIAKYLSDNVKLTMIKAATANGTSTITSDELDMAGFDGLLILTSFDTPAANNVLTLHQSVAASGEAASAALIASDASSTEDVVLDVVWNPTYRYAKAVVTLGTSSPVGSIWAIQYGARTKSQGNATVGTIALGQFTSPALA